MSPFHPLTLPEGPVFFNGNLHTVLKTYTYLCLQSVWKISFQYIDCMHKTKFVEVYTGWPFIVLNCFRES